MTENSNEAQASTAVARAEPIEDGGRSLDLILRAALNPDVSPEKMSALFDLHAKMADRAARLEFTAALARAAANFPTVERRGKIVIYSKSVRDASERSNTPIPAGTRPQQETAYPLYEDIRDAITPALSAEGLTLSFKVNNVPAGDSYRIVVVGYLRHRDGHEETAETPPLMHDSTGSKNPVQAVKSTVSYGKRMVAELLTNVASRGDDDDGLAAGEAKSSDMIDEAQYKTLADEITRQGGKTLAGVLSAFEIESLADLPAARFAECQTRLRERAAAAAKVRS